MNRNNGFTIVELVIVIAVIAILLAVLVPTFSNVVENANVSSDKSLVRNINNILVLSEEEFEKPLTKDQFEIVIEKYGIKKIDKKCDNHIFYYIPQDKIVVIFGIKEQKIIFPTYYRYRLLSEIEGEIDISSNTIVNQINNATSLKNSSPIDLYCNGYINNGILEKSGNRYTKLAANGFVSTGAIPIDYSLTSLTIYVYGGIINDDEQCKMHLIKNDSAKYPTELTGIGNNEKSFVYDIKIDKLYENYYRIVINDFEKLKKEMGYDIAYYALTLYGDGKNIIITHNEEVLSIHK